MHNNCVQSVQKLWTSIRKTCVRLSTVSIRLHKAIHSDRVELLLIHRLFQFFPLYLSTRKYTFSPPYLAVLYPQSTIPTINTTK